MAVMVSHSGIAQQATRKLVWEENFNKYLLDQSAWNIETGDGCPNCGWGNHKRQLYSKENLKIAYGNLIIIAKKEGVKCTLSRITTKGKRSFNMAGRKFAPKSL